MEGLARKTETMNDDAIELHLTSDPAQIAGARRAAEAFAERHGFNADSIANIGLCVNEALANVIRHAYDNRHDRPIEMRMQVGTESLRIELRDWGHGRVPKRAIEAAGTRDPMQPGGLGLPCLKQLLDGIEFVPQPDGMLLKMTKRR